MYTVRCAQPADLRYPVNKVSEGGPEGKHPLCSRRQTLPTLRHELRETFSTYMVPVPAALFCCSVHNYCTMSSYLVKDYDKWCYNYIYLSRNVCRQVSFCYAACMKTWNDTNSLRRRYLLLYFVRVTRAYPRRDFSRHISFGRKRSNNGSIFSFRLAFDIWLGSEAL